MKMRFCSIVVAALLLSGCGEDTNTDTKVTQEYVQSATAQEQIDALAKSSSRERFASESIALYKEYFIQEHVKPIYKAEIVKKYMADYGLGYTVEDIGDAISRYINIETVENNATINAMLERYYDRVHTTSQQAPSRIAAAETQSLLDEIIFNLKAAFTSMLQGWFDESFIGDVLSFFFDFGLTDDNTEPPVVTNTAPTANAQNVAVVQNGTIAITLSGYDSDGDTLTYSVNTPAHGQLSGVAPHLTYTPSTDYTGTDNFTFSVSDGQELSSSVNIAINIEAQLPANTPPVASAQSVSVIKNSQKEIVLSATDSDGDNLSYNVQNPTYGTLSGSAPDLVYTPIVGYSGSDNFSFSVNDGSVDSEVVTVSLNVINTKPTASNLSISLDQNSQTNIKLIGSDANGDTLTYIVTEPSHGILSGTAPDLSYTPVAGYSGSDSFGYKVNDGSEDSTQKLVNIVVRSTAPDPLTYRLEALKGQKFYVKSGVADMVVTMKSDGRTGDGVMGFLSMSFSYVENLIKTSLMGDYQIDFKYIDESHCIAADAIDDDGTVYESYWFSSQSDYNSASSLSIAKSLCYKNSPTN